MNFKKIILGLAGLVILGVGALLVLRQYVDTDHSGVPLVPPTGTPVVQAAPADWTVALAERSRAKRDYIQSQPAAWDWFANFPFSQVDGTSLIVLRLLPLIDPDRWQGGSAFMSEVGLFMDPRYERNFLPRGIGLNSVANGANPDVPDLTAFTCGACHIGRVKGPDGLTVYLDGGVNTTFNINKYYLMTYQTLQTVYAGETDKAKQRELLTAKVMEALDKAVAMSPTYFYDDYSDGNVKYDAAYEAAQVALFRKDPLPSINGFADYTEGFVSAFSAYLDKVYQGFQQPMLDGFPGMADATGVFAAHAYQKEVGKAGATLASLGLPDHAGLTDYMAVWDQTTREAEWDPTKKQLINGGGQYNGNIPIPVFRNLAASMTMGLKDTDVGVAAFAAELLVDLPPSPYPFPVDAAKAKKGEALFAENCAACHQPHNGAVYDNLGTSLSRSQVVNTVLMLGARSIFAETCSPTTTVMMNGREVTPCAEYKGVSLKDNGPAIMRPIDIQHGYNATALRGIWAIAPYLHTGSVPTMRHLLVPGTRPDSFVKGLLSYDTENMGFAWQGEGRAAVTFDTTAFPALTKKGHDTDITEGGKTYKLDWTDDPAGADALIEYLKTL